MQVAAGLGSGDVMLSAGASALEGAAGGAVVVAAGAGLDTTSGGAVQVTICARRAKCALNAALVQGALRQAEAARTISAAITAR